MRQQLRTKYQFFVSAEQQSAIYIKTIICYSKIWASIYDAKQFLSLAQVLTQPRWQIHYKEYNRNSNSPIADKTCLTSADDT